MGGQWDGCLGCSGLVLAYNIRFYNWSKGAYKYTTRINITPIGNLVLS